MVDKETAGKIYGCREETKFMILEGDVVKGKPIVVETKREKQDSRGKADKVLLIEV